MATHSPAFRNFCSSSYLLAIGLFLFLYTAISAFVYFELKNLLDVYDPETRTQIWANMDLAVNSLTILVAVFATGRIAKHLGMPFTLASIPVLIGAGLLLLAAAPMVGVVVALQIIRRAGDYADLAPGPGNAVHRRGSRNALQGQTRYRYRDLSGRRHAQRLGVSPPSPRDWGWAWPRWRWWARVSRPSGR